MDYRNVLIQKVAEHLAMTQYIKSHPDDEPGANTYHPIYGPGEIDAMPAKTNPRDPLAKESAEEHVNVIKGGKGDKLQPKDVDPKELAIGIKVEREHSPKKDTEEDIALDHLKEFPDYYSRLKKMEAQAERDKDK